VARRVDRLQHHRAGHEPTPGRSARAPAGGQARQAERVHEHVGGPSGAARRHARDVVAVGVGQQHALEGPHPRRPRAGRRSRRRPRRRAAGVHQPADARAADEVGVGGRHGGGVSLGTATPHSPADQRRGGSPTFTATGQPGAGGRGGLADGRRRRGPRRVPPRWDPPSGASTPVAIHAWAPSRRQNGSTASTLPAVVRPTTQRAPCPCSAPARPSAALCTSARRRAPPAAAVAGVPSAG
jgi:hypothetical protein